MDGFFWKDRLTNPSIVPCTSQEVADVFFGLSSFGSATSWKRRKKNPESTVFLFQFFFLLVQHLED